jgi:hypothetical protein
LRSSECWLDNSTGLTSYHWGAKLVDNMIQGSAVAYANHGLGGRVEETRFVKNGTAILASGGVWVTRNTFERNERGFTSSNVERGSFEDAFLTGNIYRRNGDAIFTRYSGITVANNVVTDNVGWGVYAPNATDGGGNVAYGNGNALQCVGVVCATRSPGASGSGS